MITVASRALVRMRAGTSRIISTSMQFSRSLTSTTSFYKVSHGETSSKSSGGTKQSTIIGEIIDNAIDLRNIRPGETIEVPYELTISNSMRDFWQSAFYSHDRINTSTPFARALGLQDQVIPFGLMLFLAGSMSHADRAKLQTGVEKAHYHWPAFAGDTLKKRFIILSLRPTSNGLHSIFTILCELRNQRGVVLFTCEKTMLFPFQVVPPSDVEIDRPQSSGGSEFLEHLISRADILQNLESHTLSSLRPHQLIIHTLTRPLSETHLMQLASLARLTHERHFNTRLFRKEELWVPGGLVLGLTCSLASRDLHEVLFEELSECSFPNYMSPGDTVGAVTYVSSREEHITGDIEALNVRTIGKYSSRKKYSSFRSTFTVYLISNIRIPSSLTNTLLFCFT
jgi:hypothetical protein